MVTIKIECGCGQKYSFDVEPAAGRMPWPVACPVCGADGTMAANETLAQSFAQLGLAAAPVMQAAAAQPALVAAAPGVRLASPAAPAVAAAPPVIPSAAPRSMPPASAVPRPIPAPARRGKDGWATEETSFNKLGTYLLVGAAIISALITWGTFGIVISPVILGSVVAVCGLVGGIINLKNARCRSGK